jgi:hypothetical protein
MRATDAAPFSDVEQELHRADPHDVEQTLSAILQSPPFRSAKQMQKLLRFIVSETLAGHSDMLKERSIGAYLFDKRPDYDTNSDPIVRLRVAELRKRLALYYQSSPDETILINIPSGSFRAVFERPAKRHPLTAEPRQEPEPIPSAVSDPIAPLSVNGIEKLSPAPSISRLRWRKWGAAAAGVLILLTLGVVRYSRSAEEQALNKFWAPVLENTGTVLIGIGNNPIYELSNAGEDAYYKDHPKTPFQEMGLHSYLPLAPGESIDSKYLRPATNTYLTIGDVGAMSDIEYILAQRHIKLDVRFVNDLTYGDLRQNPTILIGAHNNIWTLNMTEDLRFGFQGHSTIVDRSSAGKQWTANSDRSETYAIAARLLNQWNGKVVVVLGGVGYAATRAAGDFIVDPKSILKMAKSLPRDWEKKNVEIVLHTTVKNQVPGPAEVVAVYCW